MMLEFHRLIFELIFNYWLQVTLSGMKMVNASTMMYILF